MNNLKEEVYDATTRALVQKVVQGGNATVLAYGATGAGKTYTMVGTAEEPGVMVRALDDLFKEASNSDTDNKTVITFMLFL
jgi:kinesin family member 18/19